MRKYLAESTCLGQLIIGMLVTVFGGLFVAVLVYVLGLNNPSPQPPAPQPDRQVEAQSRSTVPPLPTVEPTQSLSNTSFPQSTDTPSPATTPIPDYEITFDRGTAEGWPLRQSGNQSYTVTHLPESGELRFTITPVQGYEVLHSETPPDLGRLETFVLEVELRAVTAPTGRETMGVLFRRSEKGYYYFGIRPVAGTAQVYVMKSDPYSHIPIKEELANKSISGSLNTLRVEARGQELRFWINDEVFLDSVFDSSLDFGKVDVAFYVPSGNTGVFALSALRVWKLSAPFPANRQYQN